MESARAGQDANCRVCLALASWGDFSSVLGRARLHRLRKTLPAHAIGKGTTLVVLSR